MEKLSFTPAEILAAILGFCSGLLILANVAEKISKAVQAAKAPNVQQNKRLDDLDDRMEKVEEKLNRDHDRFQSIDEGMHVTQRALLALLDHGLDGNNVKQMQDAKDGLQNYLINR